MNSRKEFPFSKEDPRESLLEKNGVESLPKAMKAGRSHQAPSESFKNPKRGAIRGGKRYL